MRRKRSVKKIASLSMAASLLAMTASHLQGQQTGLVITALQGNGIIRWTYATNDVSTYRIEWAPIVEGPWTSTWEHLCEIAPTSTSMSAQVPMFYRVVARPRYPNMERIPAGTFQMGDTFHEGAEHEAPVHDVYVSAFYMDRTEVTKALWDEVYHWATNHGYDFDGNANAKATNHPVHNVTWYDCAKWCNARSQKEGLTPCYYTDAGRMSVYTNGQLDLSNDWVRWDAEGYRLPTEAEWEKAGRGGVAAHRFPWSDADTITHDRANYCSDTSVWYDVNLNGGFHPAYTNDGMPYTSPVASFPPNGYGLCDMAGNVLEWCWDWFDEGWYTNAAASQGDPRGPSSKGEWRVWRGGSWWGEDAGVLRCSYRWGYGPDNAVFTFGFRCVKAP